MGTDHAISQREPESPVKEAFLKMTDVSEKLDDEKKLPLMWGCFVNWSATLEKIEKDLVTRREE